MISCIVNPAHCALRCEKRILLQHWRSNYMDEFNRFCEYVNIRIQDFGTRKTSNLSSYACIQASSGFPLKKDQFKLGKWLASGWLACGENKQGGE